ncbi:zinc-ribbon domain-containing protein, partial [Akkermansiaceae bacterium]|nr:zinc-ribbon domain-containing protein [Akkermansiaceae bacterium]
GEDHVWKVSPHLRNKDNTGCPICKNKIVVKSNSLATTHPELVKEWHPTKNGDLTPYDLVVGTPKKVWWKCPKGDDHTWKASPHLRNKDNTGCPFCTLTPQSKQELIITFELKQFFDINPKGFKTRVDGKLWSIDIYVPEINLGIEFDGSYWHKGKSELDKLKTKKLHQEGFHIIRVRQEPLKRIFDNDVMVSKKFDGKVIVNDILNQILKEHSLDSKIISKINKYLALDSIQNEKALDKYIDIILEEKAERKKSK